MADGPSALRHAEAMARREGADDISRGGRRGRGASGAAPTPDYLTQSSQRTQSSVCDGFASFALFAAFLKISDMGARRHWKLATLGLATFPHWQHSEEARLRRPIISRGVRRVRRAEGAAPAPEDSHTDSTDSTDALGVAPAQRKTEGGVAASLLFVPSV